MKNNAKDNLIQKEYIAQYLDVVRVNEDVQQSRIINEDGNFKAEKGDGKLKVIFDIV